MFERFTDRARNVLVLAQGQATELGHNFIGTEHLLLGMVLEAEGVAGRVLRSFQVTDAVVRAKVTELAPAENISPPSRRAKKAPFTPLAKRVLELSLQEALGLGHNYIGTEHLLLALTHPGAAKSAGGDDRDGMAARILSELGAEPPKLRACVLSTLDEATSARSGEAKTGRDDVLERAVASLRAKPDW
jgi:ATP-dependent Clp protease ATP-binding subunit ClpC